MPLFRSSFLAACLIVLLATPAFAATDQNYPARDDGVRRELNRDPNTAAQGDGGKLNRFVSNVLVDRYGECRWLDNNNPDLDYFVPTGTPTDWQSFYTNGPSFVRIDRCCPAAVAEMRASDGTTHYIDLEVGRNDSPGFFGRRELSHMFTLTNAEGATWNETVSETFVCTDGSWTGQGPLISGGAGTWDIGAWGACSADCEGTQTRDVICRKADGTVVDDSVCGGNKPTTAQPCGESSCSGEPGSCKTYIQSVSTP